MKKIKGGIIATMFLVSLLAINLAGATIDPQVTETGKISLSVDGLGVYPGTSGTIQVEKPAGATVRKAYMAAATLWSGSRLTTGDIKIDGVDVVWDIEVQKYTWNHWADVTSIVKSKIDAAPAGRVDFTITEANSYNIDGEILAVIFDDPNQTTDNTIVFLFGAQDVAGDTFAIGLAEPIDTSDPNLVLDMSLGISFGYQDSTGYDQYSIVEVNGNRLTSSAGGQDDGEAANGALLTVGGLDDSNANPPDPNAHGDSTSPRYDDELYDLIPFVSDGDTSINVYTQNPSNDDNIFFASLFLASTTAVVGEGILLAPISASNPVDSQHTVTATVQDNLGGPIEDRDVTFTIISGPHAGQTHTDQTNTNGQATFTYTGTSIGTDVIEATMVDSQGSPVTSNQVTKEWTGAPAVFVNPIVSFKPVAMYHLRQVNTCLGCITENLPEDVPQDVQDLLDEMQEYINNANTTGNPIYANNELLKALKCCEDIQEKLGITCPL